MTGGASVQRWGLQFTLFPYIEGQSGFEAPLSRAQWRRLGEVLRRLHEAEIPPALRSGPLKAVPEALSEMHVTQLMQARAAQDATQPIYTRVGACGNCHRLNG